MDRVLSFWSRKWHTGHRRETVLGAARSSRALAVGPTVESTRQAATTTEVTALHWHVGQMTRV